MRNRMNLLTIAIGFAAATSLLASGCLSAEDSGDELAFAGYALSADEESDDGFDETTDPEPFLETASDELDSSTEPAPDEVDAAELPGGDEATADGPDYVRRLVRVAWGQPTFDPDFDAVIHWEGQIKSDVAFIKVVRKLRFDDGPLGGDKLVPDGDPHAVTFNTVTGPHHDGLLLKIVAPRDAIEGGSLTFDTDVFSATLALEDLVRGYHDVAKVDDYGNMVAIEVLPKHDCGHGFLKARWTRLGERGGVFAGPWFDDNGDKGGYWMGMWGKVEGKRLFKGVYLNNEKEFLGTIRGKYRSFGDDIAIDGGVFRGHWRAASGEMGGVLRGTYAVGAEKGAGHARGAWRAACGDRPGACGDEMATPAADAAECGCGVSSAGDASTDAAGNCGCSLPPVDTCVDPTTDADGSADPAPAAAG